MRLRHFAVPAAIALLCAGVAGAQDIASVKTVTVTGKDGARAGLATRTAAPKGVIIRLERSGLTPGWHGAHLHEKGDCSAADFTSAGAHVHGSMPVTHGLLNAGATDMGDLPNVFAGADGKVNAELYTTSVTLAALLDADGSSVVVHASPDDYKSQPIGGAGARVACAVIK